MAQIFAVSKATKNVLTATNPNDFIFHSSYNTFKILAQGTLTSQTVNANPKTFSVAHGFSITPVFYAFCKFPDGTTALAGPLSFNFYGTGSSPGTEYGEFTPEIDATNIYFILTKPGSNYNVDIKYYIFEAPL